MLLFALPGLPAGPTILRQKFLAAGELCTVNFDVRVDNAAIYKTIIVVNQHWDHHAFSARFGWRWSDGALRLFASVYNIWKVTSKELSAIAIGINNVCPIRVAGVINIYLP
jgi:hypothetical protein